LRVVVGDLKRLSREVARALGLGAGHLSWPAIKSFNGIRLSPGESGRGFGNLSELTVHGLSRQLSEGVPTPVELAIKPHQVVLAIRDRSPRLKTVANKGNSGAWAYSNAA
jgi:hypothetical protein